MIDTLAWPVNIRNQATSIALPSMTARALATTGANFYRVPTINAPLFPIGQFCDSDGTAIFDKDKVSVLKTKDINIKYKEEPIITGPLSHDGLWRIPVPKHSTTINKATCQSSIRYDLRRT